MHLEILVEDQSGKTFLDIVVKRMLANTDATFRVLPYRGVGRIPKNMKQVTDADKRILMDQLPRLLQGYGSAFAAYPPDYEAFVIVICDLDDKDLHGFRSGLIAVLASCSPKPDAIFCLAIEEGEAWLLGDISAIKKAYPNAKEKVLLSYVNDSVCGTWERLADAIFPGGAKALSQQGWCAIGAEKSKWAAKIAPHMDFETNQSPSFCKFRDDMRRFTDFEREPTFSKI